jgi:hypothetical protein
MCGDLPGSIPVSDDTRGFTYLHIKLDDMPDHFFMGWHAGTDMPSKQLD